MSLTIRPNPEDDVAAGEVDLAVLVKREAASAGRNRGPGPLRCELISRAGSMLSQAALDYVQERLQAVNEFSVATAAARPRPRVAVPGEGHPPHGSRAGRRAFPDDADSADPDPDDHHRRRVSGDRSHGWRARTRHAGGPDGGSRSAAGIAGRQVRGGRGGGAVDRRRESPGDDGHAERHRAE